MKIYNIKDKQEYLEEVASLTQKEWGKLDDFENRVKNKIQKIKDNLNRGDYCKLILLDDNQLVGFISIFPHDGIETLTPWYATMYVKREYRKKGYSKILNDAILKEAKQRGFKKIYLKTTLNNYYEKFGAKYLKTKDNERIYYFDIK